VGLSLHVESTRGAQSRQILIDFGYTPETLNNTSYQTPNVNRVPVDDHRTSPGID
jgi:hypothetical protein